ncbi:hypothetical protein [Paenibacillus illinoisensis]
MKRMFQTLNCMEIGMDQVKFLIYRTIIASYPCHYQLRETFFLWMK